MLKFRVGAEIQSGWNFPKGKQTENTGKDRRNEKNSTQGELATKYSTKSNRNLCRVMVLNDGREGP